MGHRRSDEERLRQLLDKHHEAVVAYFTRRLDADSVDDAVATVFATAWRQIDGLPAEPQSRAWLYGVARNTVQHEQRSWSRRTRLNLKLAAEPIPDPTIDPADLIAEQDKLNHAARGLNPAELELLELISWEELRPNELAVILGCSVNAATLRVHRMRRSLAAQLDLLTVQEEMS